MRNMRKVEATKMLGNKKEKESKNNSKAVKMMKKYLNKN